MIPGSPPMLTDSQRAAVAKLACCLTRPGGVALLCGPCGVGTTTVLRQVAAELTARGMRAELESASGWQAALPAGDGIPDVLLVDDAHLASTDDISRLVDRCLKSRPAAGLVLAGEGRLFSLVARDTRIEAAVAMRVVLRPCGIDESRGLVAARLPQPLDERLVTTVHEIAAGIPAAMLRLVELAAVLAAARPDGRVTADDVETIHRRLSPQAA